MTFGHAESVRDLSYGRVLGADRWPARVDVVCGEGCAIRGGA